METLILDRPDASYLVSTARLVRTSADVPAEMAAKAPTKDWSIDKANPYLMWVAGDFVEGDNPNSNRQFWTAGDLELAEYTIRYAPLNMIHKFRTPVGFFAETKNVKLSRALKSVDESSDQAAAAKGSMKIQALAGMWAHIFPTEATQVQMADEAGLLYYSMECVGSHLRCAGDEGCGEQFEYSARDTHCEHLRERTSIRHIVNPVFRGGALIVPPTNPGWKEARASVLTAEVMKEAAAFAEQTYSQNVAHLNGDLTAAGWEQLMAMVLATGAR